MHSPKNAIQNILLYNLTSKLMFLRTIQLLVSPMCKLKSTLFWNSVPRSGKYDYDILIGM